MDEQRLCVESRCLSIAQLWFAREGYPAAGMCFRLNRRRCCNGSPIRLFEGDGFIIDTNNNVQTVTTAGTTGGPSPQWKTVFGQTTTDGTVVRTNNGPASWQAGNPVCNRPVCLRFEWKHAACSGRRNVRNHRAGLERDLSPHQRWIGSFGLTMAREIQPVVQPALTQARINQLSEQLSQVMAQKQAFTTLADIFPTLPPSGILPASSARLQ